MDTLTDLFAKLTCGKVAQTVIYARVSSEKQASINDQIALCKAYAERRNLPSDVYVFTDVGSGTNVSKLKSHSLMMNQVVDCFRSHLVINDMSRLGRCTDVFKMVEFIVGVGIKIHSVQDDLVVERESPFSVVRAYTLISSAVEFSKNLSLKIRTSLATKKKRGVFTGRKVPYGFKLKVIEKERFLVRDPLTFETARKLAKTTRKTVKRPEGMTPVALKQHRLKFRSYVKMAKE